MTTPRSATPPQPSSPRSPTCSSPWAWRPATFRQLLPKRRQWCPTSSSRRDDTLTLEELSARAGPALEESAAILRYRGIGATDATLVRFGEADVEVMRFFHRSLRILTDREGREPLHVVGIAMASATEASVSAHVQGPERRTTDWVDGARLAEQPVRVDALRRDTGSAP